MTLTGTVKQIHRYALTLYISIVFILRTMYQGFCIKMMHLIKEYNYFKRTIILFYKLVHGKNSVELFRHIYLVIVIIT